MGGTAASPARRGPSRRIDRRSATTVETAARLGIGVLTLYAFSSRTGSGRATEVSTLMMLLKRYLRSELKSLLRNNIRFSVIGRRTSCAGRPGRAALAMRRTRDNRGMLSTSR
jgi:undecaprenyl diphosphate synthase